MKTLKRILWFTPLALLIVGCAAPVTRDTTIAEWQNEGLLPPTGSETTRVYSAPETYPAATEPNIVVQTDQRRNTAGDQALADAIREQVADDRGLAPSLRGVTIEICDGRVILQGLVKSDLDSRVIVDALRDIPGVSRITNNLVINPDMG